MVVKFKLVGKKVQFFHTNNFMVSSLKDMHPDILEVFVYTDGGKKMKHLKRPFQKYYEKYKYTPLPVVVQKEVNSQETNENWMETNRQNAD